MSWKTEKQLRAASEFYGLPVDYLKSLPQHRKDCALIRTHHLTCTCDAYRRSHQDPTKGSIEGES